MLYFCVLIATCEKKQVIRVKKLVGLPSPRIRITWVPFLGSEEPSLKLLHLAKLLRLRVGMHIIYIYIYIGRALHTGSRNENNIGAATGSP